MKQPMGKALWSDCETDEERAEYLVAGRVNYAGINRRMLVALVAKAFEDAAKWRKLVGVSRARRVPPPWGPDAVPLMQCPSADKCTCPVCDHRERHVQNDWCLADIWGCPACVQVGWRERSKP